MQTIDAPVISLDILPTVVDALGLNPPNQNPFDGKSLLSLLSGKKKTLHEVLYWNSEEPKGEWAVRQRNWKAHGFKDKYELYDLEKNPSELRKRKKLKSYLTCMELG